MSTRPAAGRRDKSDDFRPNVIFAIRDAKGLSANEKLFLFVVESRGVLFTSAARAAEDMGISVSTFRKVARSLEHRGIITAHRSHYPHGGSMTTRYRVVKEKLTELVPERESEGSETATPTPVEDTGAGTSRRGGDSDTRRRGLRQLLAKGDLEEDIQGIPEGHHQEDPEEGPGSSRPADLQPNSVQDDIGQVSASTTSIQQTEQISDGLRTLPDWFDLNAGGDGILCLIFVAKYNQSCLSEFHYDKSTDTWTRESGRELSTGELKQLLSTQPDLLYDWVTRLPEDQIRHALSIGWWEYEDEKMLAIVREAISRIS